MVRVRTVSAVVVSAAIFAMSSPVSTQQFGSITFPTSGAPRRAGGLPHRREGAAQLPVRRGRRRLPAGAESRPAVRPRLLGRGDEPQPSAVGAAGPRQGQGRRSSGWRRPTRRGSPRPSCPRRRRSSRRCRRCISAPATSSRATSPTRPPWRGCTNSGRTTTRSASSTRCRCSARCGRATRASAARRWPRRSPRRSSPSQPESPRRGAFHHPLVRRPRSRAAGPRGGQRLREDRPVGGACAAHALAHLRPARHVAAGGGFEHRGLQGGRRPEREAEAGRGPGGLPHARLAELRQPDARQVRRVEEERRVGEGGRRSQPDERGNSRRLLEHARAPHPGVGAVGEARTAGRRGARPPAITPTCRV